MIQFFKKKRKIAPAVSAATLAAVTCALTGCNEAPKTPERLPNVVIIFADDMGYADIGPFGAKGFKTPNIDKLAEKGMKFTNFYASQAVCSASRASLLTGCYSNRVGIKAALMPWAKEGLHPNETTIAELVKQKDYATAIFGKWHLGHHKQHLPLQHGFDEYLGLPYSNDMWPVEYDGKPVDKTKPHPKPWKLKYAQLPLIDGNHKTAEIRTLEDQATLTTMYTNRATQFIDKNKDKPFLLYLPHSMPHVPLAVSDKFKGKSEQGLYGDVIMEIDWSVGEVMESLKRNGLEDNTIVIFTSDNGPWLCFGNHAGSAEPLREGKGSMWEGGPRVPCIVKWPGKIPAGTQTDKICSTIDILPTIAAITGAQLPKHKIDGVNLLPLWKNEKDANPRNHFYMYYHYDLIAVREGDWKLSFPHEYRSYKDNEPGKDGFPGPTKRVKSGLELYNLKTDISETKNVIEQHPEIVERLKKLAETAREDLGDALTKRKGKNVRKAAFVAEAETETK